MPSHHKQSHPFRLHRYSLSHVAALPALATNRLLASSAASLIGLFLPIFLYEFFNLSIQLVLLWFVIDFTFKIPFFIWAAKIFSKTGLVVSMIIGSFGAAIFYISMYFLDFGTALNPYIFLGAAIVGLMILSSFYWSPFHVDFAEFSTKGRRGRQLGIFYAAQRIVGIAGPILAALIITMYGFGATFFFSLLILLISIFPLFYLPRTKVKYEFAFWQTFQEMFSKRFRNMSFSMMAYGAENIVGVVVWPIFLYIIFSGNYLDIGVFATVIMIISLAFELLIGKATDKNPIKKMLKWGTGVYALGWIWKAFVDTIVGVFAASTFHSLGSILVRTPMDTLMYEQAADSGHYIDEYTTIRELALTFGRVGMMVLLIGVTTWFSIPASFIIAAVVSLGINMLASRSK